MSTRGKTYIFLSVIIPVYNTAKWLRESLDTILAQNAFELEIICIDDGSTDESLEILREYEKKYPVKVITQENQGPSAARNTGLDAANGEYIWFFDSDDTINPNALWEVYQAIIANQMPQVICFPVYNQFSDKDYLGPRHIGPSRKAGIPSLMGMHTGPEAYQILLQNNRDWVWICMHMIRKDFLLDNNLRLLESLRRHEDGEFMLRVYRDAVSVLSISHIVVNRRIREGSSIDIVSRKITQKDLETIFCYIKEIYKTFSESEVLLQKTPAFMGFIMSRIKRCQKYYQRFIQKSLDNEKEITFFANYDDRMLFDLLIRYPVETGRSLLDLEKAENRVSLKKKVFSMLPKSLKKNIRRLMSKIKNGK